MDKLVQQTLSSRVYDIAKQTPLGHAPNLSRETQANVYLKREDLQPVFSFKIRGAYNKMAQLSTAQQEHGVIAASAGNHAQGVALSAQKLGISALIVMPRTTPEIKVEAVRSYGAEVVLAGDSYSETAEHCNKLVKETGRTFIHPYDDPLVIAGQGTIGKELLEQLPTLTHIFAPVGGGGLIAGVASYVKHLAPHVRVIGVEPEDAACLTAALKQHRRVTLPHVGIFADGVAVKQIGKETFKLAKKYVDDVITVNNDQLCAAIKSIFEDMRTIVEPAGALGVAGIQAYARAGKLTKSDNVVAINSGANMSFERLQYVTERTLIGSGKEALFSIMLPEKPGALQQFCNSLGKHAISEFNYRQSSIDEAHILVGILTQSPEQVPILKSKLARDGYTVEDLTHSELAKEHIRHMVGGKTGPEREVLVHFDFPERPGALSHFLDVMSNRWNISLFHYRGTGSDNGRVLIGFNVPQSERHKLVTFLKKVGYYYQILTHDSAYQTFLAPDRPVDN